MEEHNILHSFLLLSNEDATLTIYNFTQTFI